MHSWMKTDYHPSLCESGLELFCFLTEASMFPGDTDEFQSGLFCQRQISGRSLNLYHSVLQRSFSRDPSHLVLNECDSVIKLLSEKPSWTWHLERSVCESAGGALVSPPQERSWLSERAWVRGGHLMKHCGDGNTSMIKSLFNEAELTWTEETPPTGCLSDAAFNQIPFQRYYL